MQDKKRILAFGLLLLSLGFYRNAAIRVLSDHPTIQAGSDAAADSDTVLVADRIYTGVMIRRG